MVSRNFATTTFGQPTQEQAGPWGFWYYKPRSLPRVLDLAPETITALSAADSALGQLNGLGLLITDPQLLIGPYITREALSSSRIEGTQASLDEVLRAEAQGEPTSADIAEVEAYIRATHRGLELLDELPICQRLMLEVHGVLLQSVRGHDKRPGELRGCAVWVGSPTDTPDTAEFVPPLPGQVAEMLSNLERFIHETPQMPPLIKCALVHYQFETIHPFLDGNGRVGRLLIGLLLQQQGRLASPLLYLSGYLEIHRREYYARLQAIRERGEVQQWLQFFLTAVTRQADDAVHRATQLLRLHQGYLGQAATARSRLAEVIPLLFSNPFISVRRVSAALQITDQGSRNLLRDAQARGWLEQLPARSAQHRWIAREVFTIIDAPPNYRRQVGG
ncbi:MAG: Fic family protein [Angustibacter sp.]